jgi:hypothetical protein
MLLHYKWKVHNATKFSETDIINMLQGLIDNIFVILGGRVFQQTDGISMGINCASLLADLFGRIRRCFFLQNKVSLHKHQSQYEYI